MARRESVGDVHEQQPRAGQARQLLDVREDRLVGVGVFDGDEDVAVHGACPLFFRGHPNGLPAALYPQTSATAATR